MRQARGSTDNWWLVYLVAGAITITSYYLIGLGGPPVLRVVLYCSASASAAIAVLIGCFRNLPTASARLPWLVLAASQIVYATADTCFYVAHFIFNNTTYPALADPFYLAHYPLVMIGLILLIRRRTPGHDLASLLDAGTVAVVGAMLSWLYLIGPQARAESPSLIKLASAGYPVMDLMMFAVGLRLILGPGRRPVSFIMLTVNLGAILTADSCYVMQQLDNTYYAGNFLDALWLGGNLMLGVAALHPTASQVADRASSRDPRLSSTRLVVLAGAALIAPAMLVVQYYVGATKDIPAIAGACAVLFILTICRLAGVVADQRRLAITDVLTGLRTRRFFGSRLPLEIAKANRAGSSLAVLIVDVDHFKSINDRYGHPAGDRVLIEVARRLRASVRHADFVARYGGEEFALVVPDTDASELADLGERLRTQVASSPIQISPDVAIKVTVSVGSAGYPRHGSTPAELIIAADRALYAAKYQGRDRVVVGGPIALDIAGLMSVAAGPTGDPLVYLHRVADEVDSWLSNSEHSHAVSRWSAMVAAALGLDTDTVRRTELAGRLHDVGKVLIPQAIWRKPGKLSAAERQLVEQHADYGYQLLVVLPDLHDIAEIVRQHHERFDGDGYPMHLAGKDIRLEARIITVCDSWAAMLADRPYQGAREPDEACAELLRGSGSQFDPEVVRAFVDLYHGNLLGELRKLTDQVAPV